MKNKYLILVLLIIILSLQIILRLPFLAEPLETDEGAYAYIAQRMLKGEVAYRDYFDHKPPGVYFIYAGIFKLFGDSFAALKNFTLIFSLFVTLAVFWVGFLLWGGMGGLMAALLYALFSGGPYIQGTSANTETFMVLPLTLALGCCLVFEKDRRSFWIFLAGLLSGLAFMIKQVSVFNFIVLAGFILISGRRDKDLVRSLANLGFGFILFPLFFMVYFWLKGAKTDFIDGFLLYNLSSYSKSQVWYWPGFAKVVLKENLVLWLLSLIMLGWSIFRRQNILLLSWSGASLLGVIAGKSFFGHYFIQVIPALSLLSAAAVLLFIGSKRIFVILGVALAALSINLGHWVGFLFSSAEAISIKKYNTANFIIARETAAYIKTATLPDEAVYVWGAEPEVYFYSQRRSASKYIYYLPIIFGSRKYSLRAQARVLADLNKSRPRYIVLANPEIRWPDFINLLNLNYLKIGGRGHWQVWERREQLWQK